MKFFLSLFFLSLPAFALLPEQQRNLEADNVVYQRERVQERTRAMHEQNERALAARNAAIVAEMARPPYEFKHFAQPPIQRGATGAQGSMAVVSPKTFSLKTMVFLAMVSFLSVLWALHLVEHAKKKG